MRENFLILKSYYEAIEMLPVNEKRIMFEALVEYGMEGKEPNLSGYLQGYFLLIKPNIDAGNTRYDTKVANGKKGGAPLGNKNAKKQPKSTGKQQEKDKDEEKEKEKDKDKEESCSFNIAQNAKGECEENEKNLLDLESSYLKKYSELFDYHEDDKFGAAGHEIINAMLEVLKVSSAGNFKFNHEVFSFDEIKELFDGLSVKSFDSIVSQMALNKNIEKRESYIIGCIFKQVGR